MDKATTTQAPANPALRQQIAQGFGLLQHNRLEDAARLVDTLVAANAADPEVLFLASEVQLELGDAQTALGFISAAVDAMPGQLALLLKKAENLLMLRRRADAREVASEALVVAGDNGKALQAVAKVFAKSGDPERARQIYQQAVTVKGSDATVLYDLATAQFFTGDAEGAEQNIDEFLRTAPKAGHALYLRATLRRQTEERNHVAELEQRLKTGFPDDSSRAACLFALAKELEDLGQDEKSFSALSEATNLKRKTLTHDAASERANIDEVRKTFTREVMETPAVGHEEAGAIFIVGMPRSGTTLLERMLGLHSEVESAEELLDFGQVLAAAARKVQAEHPEKNLVEASLSIDFAALGREYMKSARQAARGSRVFIDKMPINFIYCGLIKKALPNARILHLVRDPMDVCYAVYKTLFNQAYPFSYDIDELAGYYTCYHRMMRHWHDVMPGGVLDVPYEDLVTNTEEEARRILAWCGLEWEPAVLNPSENKNPSRTASAAQVREPIYTSSVQKWRKYEAGLAPLRDRLVAAGIVDA
jgi:tetratricopeptide (TPR) repeat protein